jgi:hypothetical protein
MIKYLFSDLDGTLYINDDISREDTQAVADFVAAGGVFSVATGRTDLEILNFVKEENFPPARFRISNNGALVMDGTEELLSESFSMAAKTFLARYFADHFVELHTVEVGTRDWIYFVNESDDWVLNYKGTSYEVNPDVLTLFDDKDFNVLKLFVEGTEEFIAALVSAIEQNKLPIDVFNDVTSLNLAPKGTNKGIGIQAVMQKYNIAPEEIAVIGDGANDIDMFNITPNSFTFYHAKEFVQAHAAYTVESVADAIGIIMNLHKQ